MPLSGLDIEALLKSNKPKKISKANAVPEFKQFLEDADTDKAVADAVNQMIDIIIGDKGFLSGAEDTENERALEHIRVLRGEMVEYEFPDIYNNFIKDLKTRVLKNEFGERREFWVKLSHNRLGLIDHETVEASDVSPEEAAQVSNDIQYMVINTC